MEFDNLKSLMSEYSDETPTLTRALFLIESLFRDITKAAHVSGMAEVPIGEDVFPVKLSWLLDQTHKMYRENEEEMTRGKMMLDLKIQQTEEDRKKLDSIANVSVELQHQEKMHQQLEQKLQQAQSQKEQYDTLTQICAEMETKIEELNSFDYEGVQKRIDELTAEQKEKETEKESLCDLLEGILASQQLMKDQIVALDKQILAEKEKENLLHDQQTEAEKELDESAQACKGLENSLRKIEAENKKQLNYLAVAAEQKKDLEQQVERLISDAVEPMKQQVAEEQVKCAEREQELNQLKDERDALNIEHQNLIIRISSLRPQIENLKGILDGKHHESDELDNALETRRSECDVIEDMIRAKSQELDDVQAKIRQMEEKTLPELQAICQTEHECIEKLNEKLQTLSKNEIQLNSDKEQLSQNIRQKEAELAPLREEYQSLLQRFENDVKDIEALRENIAELKDEKDRKKPLLIQQQLKDELDALKEEKKKWQEAEAALSDIRREAEELGQQIQKLELAKEQESRNRARFLLQKKELSPYADPEFVNRAAELEPRLKLLEAAGKDLERILKTVVKTSAQNGALSIENLNDKIRQQRDDFEKLQQALMDIGKAIEWRK